MASDVEQIWVNCERYNQEGSEIIILAHQCRQIWRAERARRQGFGHLGHHFAGPAFGIVA